MNEVDWAAISIISGVAIAGFGYLSAQLNRVDDRLSTRVDRLISRVDRLSNGVDSVEARLGAKIDQLTERYISHLEHHPR